MPQLNIEDLIRTGEGQTTEFKRSLSLQDKGLEALCAMVNSDYGRGTVAFGIESDGTICGIESGNLDTAQCSLSQIIRNKFEPSLVIKIETYDVNDKVVLLLSSERVSNVPYHEYDGRAWIREGSTNRRLSLAEKESLITKRNRDRHPGPWRCNRCGALVGVLNSFEITSEGMRKTYKCGCGGEFWPIT